MNIHSMESNSVCTTCPYCGVGCGVRATSNAGVVDINGDKDHPANFGKLCSKGYALADTLGNENRLTSARIDGSDVPWSMATKHIADKFNDVLSEHGPEAIAFYVSGQLLTEDYYVANKFVKGYLGTANIDTNSRLCMASSVAGHIRAFGSDTVPGCYEDLEVANLVVLVGSNLAWCHPVLFQRLEQARRKNADLKVIVIDPRKTATAELADVHLAIKPGGESDAILFAGLLRYLSDHDALDADWIAAHTSGFSAAVALTQTCTLENVAAHVGLSEQEIKKFYALFHRTPKVVTAYSQGVNQSHKGSDTVNSIINVHLATGRIGKRGCGPFSVTGQPNAMGGREVGGLANMLACHMDVDNDEHRSIVKRYWNSPHIASRPGFKAIDLFDAVRSGKIKALWVMATNPADSMPLANDVADAISACPFVVVSDVVKSTDTLRLANVQLPAQAWAEKSGTVTNSERRISRQRSFKSALPEARPDWWAICQVAKSMGFDSGFDYDHPSEIFKEYAGLSGFENDGSRDFDISHYDTINESAYDNLIPFQWPESKHHNQDSARFFTNGRFYTPDKKARFIAIELDAMSVQKSLVDTEVDKQSFVLNTGRVRDQWHTMTRTGSSVRLSTHIGEPFIEIHPDDAALLAISDANLVDVNSASGSITVRALLTARTQPGSVFIPMHWNDQFASNARVNVLVGDKVDPVSGQPALKNQRVSVQACRVQTYGYMLSRSKPFELDLFDYWAVAPIDQGWKTEFASYSPAQLLAKKLTGQGEDNLFPEGAVGYADVVTSSFRYCWFSKNTLEKAIYLSAAPVNVARQAMNSFFTHRFEGQTDRLAAVSGAGFADQPDTGVTVCSCMNVGAKTIQSSIVSGCNTIDSVGTACGAGTQCGSCRSEILAMLKQGRAQIITHKSSSEIFSTTGISVVATK